MTLIPSAIYDAPIMAKAATDSWWTRAKTHDEFRRLHAAELARIVDNGDRVKSKDLVASNVSQDPAEAATIAGWRAAPAAE